MKLPLFRKQKVKLPEMIFGAKPITIKDIVAPASVKVTQKYIELGERLAKSFFVFSFPRYLSTVWMSPVVNLDTPLDIGLYIYPADVSEVLRQLRKRVTEVQSEIIDREEKGLIRDPELETAYRDMEELRDKLQTAQEKMFHLGVYITIYGDTEEELRDIETDLRSILEARLIYIKPALFQQKEGFLTTAPYGLDKIQVFTPMNTAPLSSVFPFVSFDLSSNEGILYGINRHNNSLILFDRFTLENANSVLFGKAGGGKSIRGSEPVLVKNKGEIKLTKIGPLIEKLIKKQGAEQIDEELEGVINPGIEVYSFDKNLKGKWSKVTVAARKKAPKTFYKFKTRSGREITTTGDHNLIILKNGKVKVAKSSEIQEGEFIPLPRSVEIELSEKIRATSYLKTFFEKKAKIENDELIVISKSKQLISEIAYLLYYFGIVARISKKRKRATNCNWKGKRIYWVLTISGQENLKRFAKEINFISERKKRQLKELINKEGNTNVDLVPGLAPVIQEMYQLFPPLFWNLPEISEWKNGKRNPSPQHLQEVITKIEGRIQEFKDKISAYKVLGEFPELSEIINLGKSDKDLNRQLWQVLGKSWWTVKNKGVKPGSINTFKALKVINGSSYSLPEIKTVIHKGFREMALPIKYFNRCLQPALTRRLYNNTDYEMIQKAAQFVWQNYQEVLTQKIPQIEEKLVQLKVLAQSDLFWDEIVEVKKLQNKRDKYVYDLTVDNEVFLAGEGGMFVHNSYAVKLEILRSLMLGTSAIVIDPENEYEFLSDAVGGSFLSISLGSPHHINPFDLPPPRKGERAEDILRANIINLVGLIRLMLGGLTPEEDAIIDRALTETYAAKDITPATDPNLWPDKVPLFSDLEEILETMEGAESLLRRLQRFTRGTYAGFFNQPTNISMDKDLVVFGIRDMEEGLRPMAMYIIMRYIWNAIRAELKKRIMVIDEAWWLMQSEDGASFLYGLAKRARKYWLGVTTITQDVIDFLKSDYGKPIITNSSLQLLMKQSTAAAEIVQKTFDLTEAEKRYLVEAPVGEGLFFAGQKHVGIRIVASYAEDQIITTAPEEVVKIRRAKQQLTGS